MKIISKKIIPLLLLMLFVIPSTLQAQDLNKGHVEAPEEAQEAGVNKLAKTISVINEEYVADISNKKIVEDAIKGMLKELDPHSVYIAAENYKKVNEPLKGNFEGIGIRYDRLEDTLVVISTIFKGPSEKAGLMAGDKIITVNGESIVGAEVKDKEITKRLKGPKGTEVNVGVKRHGVKKLLDLTIVRDKIPIYSVDAKYMVTPTVGYIKVNKFSATTRREFRAALMQLEGEGMKDLILDLRNNGGGYLTAAVAMVDEFLGTKKMIVYTQGRKYRKKDYNATSRGNFEEGRLVVMINEGSASASEIVSGAVQDWDRGLIVGRRSFGKGLVQRTYVLPDSSAMRLTIARYYTPAGRSIQKPYDKGQDDYHKDMKKRRASGELYDQSKIEFNDSLKFETNIKKRPVYGGGGIMPDVFVSADTSHRSTYYRALNKKGVVTKFLLTYMDKNRKKLTAKYPDLDSYVKGFSVDNTMINNLVALAEKEGVERDSEGLATARTYLTARMKGVIARYMFGTEGYYKVINDVSPIFQKAINSLKDDTFTQMDIGMK